MRSVAERNEIVMRNQKLVSFVWRRARRFRHIAKLGYKDAFSAGQFGLIRAAEEWDETRGKFSTFAWWPIIHAIQDAARQAYAVTIPLAVSRGDNDAKWSVVTLGRHLYSLKATASDCYVEQEDARQFARELLHRLRRVRNGKRHYQAVMLWMHGWSLQRIAKKLGVSKTTVANLVQRSMERLRKMAGVHNARRVEVAE